MVGGGKDEVMKGFDVFEGALLSTVSGYIYIYMILFDLICIDIKYSSQLYSQNRTFDSVTFFLQVTSEVFESFFLLLFHMFPHHGMDSFYNISLKTSE